MVTQYFRPEPARIVSSLADELRDRGHDVQVLTAFPSYPSGELYAEWVQSRTYQNAEYGHRVVRVRSHIYHGVNPIRRMANYLSFGVNAAREICCFKNVDVAYVYATQMTAAIPAQLLRLFKGIPYVLHVQDLWPESIAGSGMVGANSGTVLDFALRGWLRATYRNASGVIGIAPTMADTLVARGAQAEHTHAVYNWAPPVTPTVKSKVPVPRLNAEAVASQPSDGDLRLMYAGNLGEMQDIDTLLRAFVLLKGRPIRLDIFGDGVAEGRLRRLRSELALDTVHFHGRVDPKFIGQFSLAAHFHIITLKDLPVFRMTIPSKFQVALANGRPVISNVAGDLANLIEQHGVGLTAAPGDPDALAGAILKAAEIDDQARSRMAESARRLYDSEMSVEHAVDRIESVLSCAVPAS